MRISRKKVFEYLSRCQDEKGGCTGRDIAELAKLLLVSRKALKKRIDGWTLTDSSERMFSMGYDESKFRERFYQAIGFLGRNLRYNDSPAFHGLQYFIQRYVSDSSLDLEFRHLWKTYRDITGLKMLWNEGRKNFQLDDLIQLVETSNRQKRLVRIVERGVTRVHEPNVSRMLKASESILLMVGIINIRRERVEWQMSPISMEDIALYIPA